MLARDIKADKVAFGLVVDIRPILLKVLIDRPCPEHNKPVVFITTLNGVEPDNKCIDCLMLLLNDLANMAEENTIFLRQKAG